MKPTFALPLLGALLAPALLPAQPVYFYRPPEAEEPKSRFSVGGAMIFGINANLADLGDIPYPSIPGLENALVYNDGFIVANPDGGLLTSNYAFAMDNAQVDQNGYVTSFDLTRYRSESLGASAQADIGSGYGWEIAYDYQLGENADRFRFGIRAGLSFNNLDFSSDTTVEGRFIRQSQRFEVPAGTITYVPGSGYQGSGQSGTPPIVFDPNNDLTPGEEQEVIEPVWDGEDVVVHSRVNSVFEIDGLLVNFRVGPTVAMRLVYGFDFELSAGALAVFYSGDVSMRETLVNLPTTNTQLSGADTRARQYSSGTDGEFLFGFYGEGLLRFRATERVSFYSSLVYMRLQDPENAALADVDYQLSFESPSMATAGMTVRF